MEQEKSGVKLTEEQLRFIKQLRLLAVPLRLVLGLTFFSLIAGGWGRFFAQLPGAVFALLFCAMVITERLVQTPDVGGERKDRGSVVFLWVGFGLAYAAAIADYYWLRPHWAPWPWNVYWVLAGVALYIIGQLIRVMAIRTLGRFFTISVRRHQGHRVVTDGPYRLVRHPAYSGLWLMAVGFILVFASLPALVYFLLVGTGALLYRIKVEEKMLLETFGDEYRNYMKRTRRLIPGVV
jgi:protein-S-isoprenylcysteine O-methyltransferase Ste14